MTKIPNEEKIWPGIKQTQITHAVAHDSPIAPVGPNPSVARFRASQEDVLTRTATLGRGAATTEFKRFLALTEATKDRKLIKRLETNLYPVQAVLNDAEQRQINDLAVKKWLDNLKDADV
ncbi:hypothetical protein Ahy_B05g076218 [Arachis hypogaea]|uniref:Disease resistance N-terminal domain-containing protein n=1 Tax=Arachis hypogaea TaxID=3818 RepID=A0A444Z2S3_ARAHY|nr:hypothetical protein Ahy_B05g076218 [Arachis hypogaea]